MLRKTTALIKLTGKLHNKATSQCIRRTREGAFLLIPRASGTFTKVKLKSAQLYLGVMISYRNFTRLTTDCRLAAARKSLGILSPWLLKRHGLPRFRRVQLWYQCVFPSLTSGLLATGLDQHSLALLDAFSIKCFPTYVSTTSFIWITSPTRTFSNNIISGILWKLWELYASKTIQREQHRNTSPGLFRHLDVSHNFSQPWTPGVLPMALLSSAWNIDDQESVPQIPWNCIIVTSVIDSFRHWLVSMSISSSKIFRTTSSLQTCHWPTTRPTHLFEVRKALHYLVWPQDTR